MIKEFWELQKKVFLTFTLPLVLIFILYLFITNQTNFVINDFLIIFVIILFFSQVVFLVPLTSLFLKASDNKLRQITLTRYFFWKEISKRYNWKSGWDLELKFDKFIPFTHGEKFILRNKFFGSYKNSSFRFFELIFLISNSYSIFAFEFKGNFPHIYLNRIDNHFGKVRASTNLLSLPEKFRKVYEIHVPKKYEIEALQIFTPEILDYLLEKKINYDIEFYKGELIFIRKGLFYEDDQFDREFTIMTEFVDKISKNLNIISFKEIGSLSSELHYPKLMKKLAKFNLGSLLKLYAYIAIFLSTIFFLIELLRDISR